MPRMLEVYAGHTPARRNRAVVLCGALLVGTLGGAWLQARTRLALGPPVRIGEFGLIVRPPRGWVELPGAPGTFVLPSQRGRRGSLEEQFGRRVSFVSGRRRGFVAPDPRPLEWRRITGARPISDVEPAPRIAGLPAVEQTWHTRRAALTVRGVIEFDQVIIVREATSLRGDYIHVEYVPLAVPSMGDKLLLDEICREVRLERQGPETDPAELMRSSGLELALEPDWAVAATGLAEVPGFYVGQAAHDGPQWAAAVIRTRLPPGAEPAEALAAFFLNARIASPRFLEFVRLVRDDGVQVWGAVYRGRRASAVESGWLAVRSPAQVALVICFDVGTRRDDDAHPGRRIAQSVRFAERDDAGPVALDELARLLTQ